MTLRSRHRIDAVLSVLHQAPGLMTTDEVAGQIGESYSATYSTLRRLCGSLTVTYAEADVERFNVPGFPVAWVRSGGLTYWEMVAEERTERDSEVAQLEARLAQPQSPE